MNSKEILKIVNSIKGAVISSRKNISINEIPSKKTNFWEYMSENYLLDHIHLLEYMISEETKEMIKQQVPDGKTGYVQIFVKGGKANLQSYGVKFIPYRIIHKYWGLGYQNTNIQDFIFLECLYENDHTKFRGCFRKK